MKNKYESSTLALHSKFEYELYTALPMTPEELERTEKKYNENTINRQEHYNTLRYRVERI